MKIKRVVAGWLTLLAFSAVNLFPSTAFADTNRLGVITVHYGMNAGGSGQGDYEGTAGDGYGGTWPIGFTESDSLSLSISGLAKFEVLQAETNLMIGKLISSSAQESGSGSDGEHWWGWGNSPTDPENADQPRNLTFLTDPDPTDPGTNVCVIITNAPDGSGQFRAMCLKAVFGEEEGGAFYAVGTPWRDDVTWNWTGNSPIWWGGNSFPQDLEGVVCTLKVQDDIRQFQFAFPSSTEPWSRTITTNTSAINSFSATSDSAGSESGSANGGNTVELDFVPDLLTISYTATPVSGTAPLTVAFNVPYIDPQGNFITNLLWNFGDGSIDVKHITFSHCYSNAGDFTISLACTNSQGQAVVGAGPTTIHVVEPTIEFTADRTNGDVPLTVSFACPDADSGGGAIKQGNWDFGDGTTSDERNPSHKYTETNEFTVSLSVVNEDDYEIQATGPTTIFVTSPEIQFTANPLEGVAPMNVQFVCPALDSDGNPISQYAWTFGDGGTGANQLQGHVYDTPGKYTPSLVVANINGDEVDGTGPEITVAGYLGLVLNGDFETGDFYGWTNGGTMNYSTVNSTSANSGAYGAQLEGMFGSLATLSQTLATKSGVIYLLSFWLNNPPGNSANQFVVSWGGASVWGATNLAASGWTNIQLALTATATNTLLQFGFEPMSSFGLDDVDVESAFVQVSASPISGTAPLLVSFASPSNDNNNETIGGREWDFGDGTGGTGQNPAHTYFSGGRFIPRLRATNSTGGGVFGVGPAITVTTPTTQFAANPTVGIAPLTVHFTCPGTDNAGNSINSWNWSFGDGTTSAARNPTHSFAGIGQFIPALTVTNSQGVVMAATGPAITVIESTGLVLNGGFETGDFNGWTSDGNFDCFVSSYFVHSGHWSAELVPSGSPGYLSQTLATVPGANYALSFWLQSPDGRTPNEFSVSWNGTTLFDQTNLPAIGWTNLQFAVTATAASTALQFGFRDDGSYLALDDISVISPKVAYTAAPTNGQPPLTVYFVSPATDSGGNLLTSWRWDFGDGGTATTQNPVHTYANAGSLQPLCVVTNSAGLGITAAGPVISVTPPQTVQFTADPMIGAVPLSVRFTCPASDSGGHAIQSWHWDFGDGFTGTAQNPSHIYATPGRFTPALVATNAMNAPVAGSGPTVSVASLSGLVTNGDFETGDFYGWTLGGLMNYSSVYDLAQYVHSKAYGASLFGSFGPPGDSNYISQPLNATPGASYLLSFWLDNPNASSSEFLLSWGGATVFDQTIGPLAWTNVQLTLTADNSATALKFTFTSVSPIGLHDVSVVPALQPQPVITKIAISGLNLTLTGINGQADATCIILMTTDPFKPLSQWTRVATNVAANGGSFTLTATNAVDPSAPRRFYVLEVQTQH